MAVRLGNAKISLIRYVGLWTAVVLVFATQGYLHDLVAAGHSESYLIYLRCFGIECIAWIALTPLTFRLAADYPIEKPHVLQDLSVQLPASLLVATVATLSEATLFTLLESGAFWTTNFLVPHVAASTITYWILFAIQRWLALRAAKARRDVEASRLAAELAESRLHILKSKLQPHFLFNTLHTISTLLNEDVEAAEDMLLRLSNLLRAFMEDGEDHEISLQRELMLLDLYLGIQRMRFKDRLTTRIHISPDTLLCAVPSLILQPIVENAIHHGIGKRTGSDCIEIESHRERDSLCIDVRNRNSKLAVSQTLPDGHGIGLSNTTLRLREMYGNTAEVSLENLQPDGVACRIRLPFHPIGEPRQAHEEALI